MLTTTADQQQQTEHDQYARQVKHRKPPPTTRGEYFVHMYTHMMAHSFTPTAAFVFTKFHQSAEIKLSLADISLVVTNQE